MSLSKEVSLLSPLQKNQQWMSFYLLFVNALLVACTTLFYVELFGAEGMILKGYIVSLYSLVILIPLLGKWLQKAPLKTFNIALILEAFSILAYICVSLDIYPMISLPMASFLIVSSNLIMRPILTQVSSIVTNGCAAYSLTSSKLDAIYTAIGAGIGATFILFNVPSTISVIMLALSLAASRHYRKKVLLSIYTSEAKESPPLITAT